MTGTVAKRARQNFAPRRLCFGGSFNPIHNGHLICARAAAEKLGFDRVVLIPSAQPPHKRGAVDLAPAKDRLRMCQLAVEGDAFFEVNDLELSRSGPSYTIETARELRAAGWREVHWLIGADMVANLPRWHEAARLIGEVEFVVMARPGWKFEWGKLPKAFRKLREKVVETPLIEIGATSIRERVGRGESIEYLTTAAVARYIERRRLYR